MIYQLCSYHLHEFNWKYNFYRGQRNFVYLFNQWYLRKLSFLGHPPFHVYHIYMYKCNLNEMQREQIICGNACCALYV